MPVELKEDRDLIRDLMQSCEMVQATTLGAHFGNGMLHTKPEELDGMVGNVATLLMAQTVCYMQSQGEIVEALQTDRVEFAKIHHIIKSCPDVDSVEKGRR